MEKIISSIGEYFYSINDSEFIAAISSWQFVVVIIASVASLIFFVISSIRFTNKVNKRSSQVLDLFRETGKYIDGLFVEIDNKKEFLRYFVFGSKFKKKLIKEHNKLVSNRCFEDIGQHLKYNFKISHFSNNSSIIRKTEKNQNVIESNSLNRDRKDVNFAIFVDTVKHGYNNALVDVKEKNKMISEHSAILIGNAGNGKTTLLCNMAQALIRNKFPCVYINSRDVSGELKKYFVNTLPICDKFKNDVAIKFLHYINFLLSIKNKYFIIIVDALNENDIEAFTQSIGEFNEYILKFSRFKVLYSCRSEYYNIRSKKYFTNINKKPYELAIDDCYKTARATEKVFNLYREHYNYSGNISEDSKNKMLHSLLLMRMFFEINKNSNNDTSQLYNHRIFYQYIKNINNATSEIKLSDILDKISDLMIESKQFNEINIESLNYPSNTIDQILDNNLILSKKITTHPGEIHQSEVTKIYFTFDEIRDYCISRRIIDKCSSNNSFDFLFEICDYLYENKISAIEGVLKYSYFHLMEKKLGGIAKELLRNYYNYSNDENYYVFSREMVYPNLGLAVVMECPHEEFLDFEKVFIYSCMNSSFRSFINLFNNLLRNEIRNYKPNLDVFIDGILYEKTNIEAIKKHLKQEYDDESYYYRANTEKFEALTEYLDNNYESIKNNTNILKLFILLSILIPDYDYFFNKVSDVPLINELIDDLLEQCKNSKLTQLLLEFKSDVNNFSNDINKQFDDLKAIMFLMGEENELHN